MRRSLPLVAAITLAALVLVPPATSQTSPFYRAEPEDPATQVQLVEQLRATRLLATRLKASLSSQVAMAARSGDSSGVVALGEGLAPEYLDSVFVALDKAMAFSNGEGRLYSEHPEAVQSSALDRPPRAVEKPVPQLPGVAPDQRRAATVIVRALVDADGTVIGLGETKGAETFHSIARDAVQNWKFEPPVRNGTPTKAWVSVPVN